MIIEPDGRHACHRRADHRSPGEVHFFRAQRGFANDFGKDGRDHAIRTNHVIIVP
jgi:hypothetical protein